LRTLLDFATLYQQRNCDDRGRLNITEGIKTTEKKIDKLLFIKIQLNVLLGYTHFKFYIVISLTCVAS